MITSISISGWWPLCPQNSCCLRCQASWHQLPAGGGPRLPGSAQGAPLRLHPHGGCQCCSCFGWDRRCISHGYVRNEVRNSFHPFLSSQLLLWQTWTLPPSTSSWLPWMSALNGGRSLSWIPLLHIIPKMSKRPRTSVKGWPLVSPMPMLLLCYLLWRSLWNSWKCSLLTLSTVCNLSKS